MFTGKPIATESLPLDSSMFQIKIQVVSAGHFFLKESFKWCVTFGVFGQSTGGKGNKTRVCKFKTSMLGLVAH